MQGNRFLILLQDWTSRVPGNASFDKHLLAEDETSLLSNNRFSEAHAKGLLAMSAGRHTVNVALEAGGDFGANDEAQPPGFTLGGFQHLSAYPSDQFAGNFLLYGRLTYLTPIVNFDLPPFRDLFLGPSAEVGASGSSGARLATDRCARATARSRE